MPACTDSVVPVTDRLTLVKCPSTGFRLQTIGDNLRCVLNRLRSRPMKSLQGLQYVCPRTRINPEVSIKIEPLSALLHQPASSLGQLLRLWTGSSPDIACASSFYAVNQFNGNQS